jgi:hypothetical protein
MGMCLTRCFFGATGLCKLGASFEIKDAGESAKCATRPDENNWLNLKLGMNRRPDRVRVSLLDFENRLLCGLSALEEVVTREHWLEKPAERVIVSGMRAAVRQQSPKSGR